VIFTPEQIHLIEAGEKTMTRRPVRPGRQGAVKQPPGKWGDRLGEPTPIMPAVGEAAVGYIVMTGKERERLGQIEQRPDHILAEGCRSLAQFARDWLSHHDPDPDMRWAAMDPDKIDDENAVEHLRERHYHRQVWVLSFTYVTHPPNLLTARSPFEVSGRGIHSGNEHGYVVNPSSALADEPEAIDSAIVETLPTTVAARARYDRERLEREAAARQLPIEQQLAALRTDERSSLIRDDLRLIEERIARAWKKLSRAA
jgi:hypothetical protein